MDRNIQIKDTPKTRKKQSLSARRAWIEIVGASESAAVGYVALRKESVDRNPLLPLPFRAVWIVALRKESVDRNRALAWKLTVYPMSLSARRAWIEILNSIKRLAMSVGRSPQGERG